MYEESKDNIGSLRYNVTSLIISIVLSFCNLLIILFVPGLFLKFVNVVSFILFVIIAIDCMMMIRFIISEKHKNNI